MPGVICGLPGEKKSSSTRMPRSLNNISAEGQIIAHRLGGMFSVNVDPAEVARSLAHERVAGEELRHSPACIRILASGTACSILWRTSLSGAGSTKTQVSSPWRCSASIPADFPWNTPISSMFADVVAGLLIAKKCPRWRQTADRTSLECWRRIAGNVDRCRWIDPRFLL